MRAEQAWGTLTLLFALGTTGAAATLISLGFEPYQTGAFAVSALAIYIYIVYKRYHIELVTEGDIALFTDPEDLEILCGIYGLGGTGRPMIDRQRLKDFVRRHPDNAFVWTAPRAVTSFASALALPEPEPEEEFTVPALMKKLMSEQPSEASLRGSLIWDADGHPGSYVDADVCPVCDADVDGGTGTCPECGADLRFYSALADSRLGRRLLYEKTEARRRKPT